MCCSVLQFVAMGCSVLQQSYVEVLLLAVCCSELQRVAVCCSVLLECVAVCCSVRCVAVRAAADLQNRIEIAVNPKPLFFSALQCSVLQFSL